MTLEDYEGARPTPGRVQGGNPAAGAHDPAWPHVTVVTVCWNSEKTLEQTIQSVLAQTYPSLDYVLVDGASTDGTLDIIRRYGDRVTRWISEPDQGIYDAMNKGIALARSDDSYILFINADDYLDGPMAIERFMACAQGEDLLYGKVTLKADAYEITVGHPLTAETLALDMARHQATFVTKRLYRQLGVLATSYRLSSDFEFAVRAFCAGASNRFVDQVVAIMRMGGASAVGFQRGFSEKKAIIRVYYRGMTRLKALLYIDLVELPRNRLSLLLEQLHVLDAWRKLKQHARNTVS